MLLHKQRLHLGALTCLHKELDASGEDSPRSRPLPPRCCLMPASRIRHVPACCRLWGWHPRSPPPQPHSTPPQALGAPAPAPGSRPRPSPAPLSRPPLPPPQPHGTSAPRPGCVHPRRRLGPPRPEGLEPRSSRSEVRQPLLPPRSSSSSSSSSLGRCHFGPGGSGVAMEPLGVVAAERAAWARARGLGWSVGRGFATFLSCRLWGRAEDPPRSRCRPLPPVGVG